MRTRTVIEFIVDIWLPKMTIIEEKYTVEEKVDNLGDMIRADWGAEATYNLVRTERTFTF